MKLRQWCSCSVVVGITMFLVGGVFYVLVPFIAPEIESQYENHQLFRPWSGWTSRYMTIHPFLYAPVFAAIFLKLRQETGFPSGIRSGFIYGAGVFLVGSLPVFLLAFASFQVSVEIMLSWMVQNLCQYLAAGVVIGSVSSHSVHVLRVDQAAREIETEESGQLVTSWNHQMRVESSPGNQSRYTDSIHLKAGLLTPLVWLFACLFYRSRQRRLRLLFARIATGSSNE